ncbi:hypothetical protein [Granulicella tundricola]|uniref:Uncharacterized protein n=1 Tax=Granulicella tundricola (strain ATCC BAA-1859 / DSM 23138 / MP5ACTX9) TaxID=1198114 RepID=E8WX95_GRATM|nr:hypothetical protein [Granulicella tundricola]ADW69737.1 hypothetical protein AciX9_2713 [Granulicella tundricola MP5ACTX9]
MTHAIEVEIDSLGKVHPVDPLSTLPEGRAILTWQTAPEHETMLLSETALAENWLGPEEDAAWAHLQPAK